MFKHAEKRLTWHILFWVNWFVILAFWWRGSSDLVLTGHLSYILIALGRLAGLSAAFMILLQFLFMGRLPLLEKVFGLDKLSRIHHSNGQRGLILLLFHPILLIWGNMRILGLNPWTQTKVFVSQYQYVLWAYVGLALFIIVVGLSIHIVRNRFKYESWYFVHLVAYLAVFSSFWHQVNVGSDLLSSRIFYLYWIALYATVFGAHILFRFIRPIYNFNKYQFKASRVVRESYNAVSIYISGISLDKFNIQPGQFMILRFLNKKLWWQAHPFSLSMVPNGQELRVTIKELGDFTKEVAKIEKGTRIIIDGPYGVFTDLFSVSNKILFIAGGIGITPIRSLMEQMVIHGRNAILLYGNKSDKDIIFKSELGAINKDSRVYHVLSDEPNYGGEKGYIDEERIKRLVPDFAAREVYLCGPPPMMDKIISVLESMGLSRSKIHYEKFSL